MRIVEIAPLCLPVPPKGVHTLRGPWDDESRAYYGLLDDQIHFVAISETQRRANQDVRYAATSLSCPTEKRSAIRSHDRRLRSSASAASSEERASEIESTPEEWPRPDD